MFVPIKKFCIFTKIYYYEHGKRSKIKSLTTNIRQIRQDLHGKGTVMKMGDSAVEEVETISSGSLGVDIALGVNGYPKGRTSTDQNLLVKQP